MLPADAVERVIWLGGFWLLLVVAWAAICMWVEEDARDVFGKSMPWSLGFVALGALFFITTYLWGFTLLPLFTLLIPASLQGYVLVRDRKVPADERVMSRQCAEKMVLTAAEKLGMQSTVAGWFEQTEPAKRAAPKIQFLKKDGSMIDAQGGKNFDKETSQSVKTLEDVFARAIELDATDIHLDPKESGEVQVRCRVDGIMGSLGSFVGPDARGMVSALKVFGDMDIAERRRPQDGTFVVLSGPQRFDIRAATGPTSFGEKMVLRLLDAGGSVVKGGIKSLGMREAVQSSL